MESMELTTEAIENVLEALTDNSEKVIEIFNDYFGEEFVDVVKATRDNIVITVRFPLVTVTNENGNSVEIKELYARVTINSYGIITEGLRMIRSEFTAEQWLSDYAHSHLPGIKPYFDYPCLGSGPISSTQQYLSNDFDKEMWGLYCLELSKYVTVESLEGIPYRRMSSIGIGTTAEYGTSLYRIRIGSPISQKLVRKFLKYLITTTDIPISYTEGRYILGENIVKFVVKVSDIFIKWYNQEHNNTNNNDNVCADDLSRLLARGALIKATIRNNKICRHLERTNNINEENGRLLFTFKEKEVRLKITDATTGSNIIYLLSPTIIDTIISNILLTINLHYGKNKERSEDCKELYIV